MNGSLLKKPMFGFIIPWIVLYSAVFILGGVIPVFGTVRSVLSIIYHEAFRDFGRAAVSMDKWDMPTRADTDFWRRDVYRSAGMSGMLSGRFAEATEWFGRIVHFRNHFTGDKEWDYFALIYRGICHYKSGNDALAKSDWEMAAFTIPDRHDAFTLMGHLCLLKGDVICAYSHYLGALERAGHLGPIYADIGDAWRYMGWVYQAQKYYQRGLSVDPTDVFSRLRFAELALELDNDVVFALQAVDTIRQIMPTLLVVAELETAAQNWIPGMTITHIPAVRFEPGPAHSWKVAPTRLYFEFLRREWHGW